MRLYVGIDPGMDGYVCQLAVGKPSLPPILSPIPTMPTGKGAKRAYNVPAMLELARTFRDADLVALEKQQPMPKQGVTSTFSIGYGYGLWRMALAAVGVPYEEVRPASWKSQMGITGKGAGHDANARRKAAKARAIQKAQALYPGVGLLRTPRSRVASPDMAEALLLARYALHRATGLPL